MTDTLTKAGDVNVKVVEIINSKGEAINITAQLVRLEIFEDIFSPFIAGNLVLLDAIDLSSVLPLVGEERINIVVETPSLSKISQQFYLYKMSDKGKYNDTTSSYILHFMSLEGIVDANKKISKTFSGTNSDIVDKLIRSEGFHSKKNAVIETTRNSQKFTSNFWSPARAISFCMEDAESMQGSPSFVFFENREGYVFASLDRLYAVTPVQDFVFDNYTRTVRPNGQTVKDIQEDYKRIVEMHAPELYNYLDRAQSGFYASSMTAYDITTKKYTYRVFDAKSKTSTTLNDNSLIAFGANYRADALRLYVPKYYGNFNGYTDVTSADSIQQRVSMLKQAEAMKIQITVPGRLDYTVGRTVKLTIYKDKAVRAGDGNSQVIDPVMSGLYLISALNHQITHKEHVCNMELIKDSILKGK